MTVAEAQARLGRMVDSGTAPTLTAADLADLLAMSKLEDADGLAPDSLSAWAAATAYSLEDQVVPTTRNGYTYEVTTAGTSGATEPTWPTTIGDTVTDGTVVWENVEAAWTPTFDLNRGAAAGWERKAERVSSDFDFATDGQTFDRSQKAEQFRKNADGYRRKIVSGITQEGPTSYAN